VDLLIVGLLLEKQIGLGLRLLEIASRNQQVCQINAGLIVVRLQFDGPAKFLIRD